MSSPRWFRIVSTRIAVLPVPRSPMISSRWPRPIGIFESVDAGDPVADLEHTADLGEVGLDVVLLDPLLEDRGDLFGTELQAALPFSSLRSRLRRPRTLASRRSEPAWRTMPPIRSGST